MRKTYFLFVTLLVSISLQAQTCQTSDATGVFTSDSGFEDWIFEGSGNFIGHSTSNGNGIDINNDNDISTVTSLGVITQFSYGLRANLSPSAMIRAFSSDLEVGDTFNIKMDNGFNDGGIAAFQLRNSSDESLLNFRISVTGVANYQIIDDGVVDTGIPITYGGLAISITLTAVNSYVMEVTVLETGLIYNYFGNLRTRPGGQSINNVRMFNTQGGGISENVFFNNLEICRQQAGIITPDLTNLPDINGQCQATPTAPTANSGAITATANTVFPINNQGTTQIAWTYDDGNGNNFYQTQNVIIDDTTAPSPDIATLPDVTGDCDVTSLVPPTASDNCGSVLIANDAVLPITIEGTTIVTWTYDDGNGNTATQTQNIVLSPIASLSCQNITAANDPGLCEADLVIAPPTISESCSTVSNGLSFAGGFLSRVSVPNFPFQLNFTLEAWVNPIISAADGYKSVISRGAVFENNTNYAFGFRNRTVSNEIRLFFTIRNGSTIQNFEAILPSNPTGTWNHMAASFDSVTKEVMIYWNGALLDSTVFTLNPTNGGQDLILGQPSSFTSTDGAYVGQMDEVRIWDRALPATEIASSYNRALVGTEPGLLAYYKMEEGSPSTVTTDSSANGYTGALGVVTFGGPTWISSQAPVSSIALTNNITNTSDASGVYPLGNTTVTWTARDAQGNTNTCDAVITVTDNEAPVPDLATLPDIISQCEVTSLIAPTASDDCGSITVTNDASLPITTLGTTVVNWTFDDGNGNTASQTQNIIVVEDTEAPVPDLATLPDITSQCEVTSLTAPTATDACGSITVTNDASLPITTIGTTVVTWTFDDGNGNTATQIQDIIVSGPITYYADTDVDGFGDPDTSIISCVPVSGYVEDNTDCDDTNAYVYLDAVEVDDGLDNNCDGLIDNTFICFTSNTFNYDTFFGPNGSDSSYSEPGFEPWMVDAEFIGIYPYLFNTDINYSIYWTGQTNSMGIPGAWVIRVGDVIRESTLVFDTGDTFSMDITFELAHGSITFGIDSNLTNRLIFSRYSLEQENDFPFRHSNASVSTYVENIPYSEYGYNIFLHKISPTITEYTITPYNLNGLGDVSYTYSILSPPLVDVLHLIIDHNGPGQIITNNFEICHAPSTIDEDNDGYANDLDCDDNDATVYPNALEICDGKDNDCNDIIDDISATEQELIWNGSVSSDWENLNNWTPNVVPLECSEITIPQTANPPLIAGEKTIRNLNISSGSSLEIPFGATLNLGGDLNMYSVSDSYSGLIVNGTISIAGTAKYHRFTNSNSNDNDLIAPPLSGQTWTSFLTNDANYNESLIFNNGVQPMTTYLFGPFEKGATDDYVLYTDNSAEFLVSGKGYRAATTATNGEALIFTGTVITEPVTSTIINETTGGFPEWNLIGNPYPAYIDVGAFFNHIGTVSGVSNLSLLDEDTAAIYGYDADDTDITGSNWTITNLVEGPTLISPGQGFFVSSKDPSATLEFTPDMQVVGASDDFIQGRSTNTSEYLKLIAVTSSKSASTSLYFHENGTTGLDIGYDAAIFGGTAPAFSLYSHLVAENAGLPMAIQTINTQDLSTVVIPLGLNANEGEQVTISLGDYTLSDTISLYLEDNSNNSFTLLNTTDYVLTTNATLNGTGRFYLHFATEALSIGENQFKGLNIYTNQLERAIVIEGALINKTEAIVFDAIGREVLRQNLNLSGTKNVIDTSALSSGVYVITLKDGNRQYSQKLILK